jgi:hypothetical protein
VRRHAKRCVQAFSGEPATAFVADLRGRGLQDAQSAAATAALQGLLDAEQGSDLAARLPRGFQRLWAQLTQAGERSCNHRHRPNQGSTGLWTRPLAS